MAVGVWLKRLSAVLLGIVVLNAYAPSRAAEEDPSVPAIVSALIKRFQKCWVLPAGARSANLFVRVHFLLSPDGTLQSLPKVLNSSTHPLFASVKGSAVRAVVDCQPYDFLPPAKYDLWRDNTIDFSILK